MTGQASHIYEPTATGFAPTALATGPWDKRFQNGVALNALVAHVIETSQMPVDMVTSRVVVDLLKPTDMAPVEVRVATVREGRRLQLLEVELVQDNTVTVRASALRVRAAESPRSEAVRFGLPPDGLPGFNSERSAFRHILETRLESGGLESPGPGIVWARTFGEVVPGTRISPFVQAAMVADFGSGLSSYVNWREWTFANVDISLHLTRAPQGDWVRAAAETQGAGNGVAIVATRLADTDGEFGHAHQTLYLDRRMRK